MNLSNVSLDTRFERIEQLGSAQLLAVLTSDARAITLAFVRLPELIQGIIITLGSAFYLAWLSPKMLLVTSGWLIVTLIGCWCRGVISIWRSCVKSKITSIAITRR